MTTMFKVGDHVGWNSEAGHVSGRIIKVHTRDFDYIASDGRGHRHHASPDKPQYEIGATAPITWRRITARR